MTGAVSLGFALVALSIWVTPRRIDDHQDVELGFRVIEEGSGRPVHAVRANMGCI